MLPNSGFNCKRKRKCWGAEEEEGGVKQMRVASPTLSRQVYPLPDLVADHSNPTSDDDQVMDMDQDMPDSSSIVGPPSPLERCAQESYVYESGGSGGFGFGPGVEEDGLEMDMVDDMGSHKSYPSLTPHTSPNHFSNQNGNAMFRASSQLAAQPFSTGLPAPAARGIFQPTMSNPLPLNATEVEKARAQHGPWCKSIPRLIMSKYPDINGKRSMWTVCEDCGACEKTQD
ncbi:uncharacterized protein L203_103427 [Cryptococcus depauperatus CBS 7841]|uniref:Uncharacterized protein n=1 Tax=Cryptococcus depauperatus CBS 7841 TaxID=1295531 RepID=A0A1E3IIU6_9TREE|nr:hypothetical protein L203_02978 [Cryptococcus depauperatus CBS 7841]